MKNYNELFHERFEISQQIDERFVELYNIEGLKSGINYLKQIGAKTLDMDHYDIKCKISEWTKNSLSDQEKIEFLSKLTNLKDYVFDVNIRNNMVFNLPEVIIETNDGIIQAIPFSLFFPKIKKKFSYIKDNRRFGNCYDFVYHISLHLGFPNQVVTGYIYGYSDKSMFLHSWIETTIDGEEYVIDGTLNAMINKQGYYFMQHAKPITKIDERQFRCDIKNYMKQIQLIPPEVYFVFRDEIIHDLKKNQRVFKRTL